MGAHRAAFTFPSAILFPQWLKAGPFAVSRGQPHWPASHPQPIDFYGLPAVWQHDRPLCPRFDISGIRFLGRGAQASGSSRSRPCWRRTGRREAAQETVGAVLKGLSEASGDELGIAFVHELQSEAAIARPTAQTPYKADNMGLPT